MSNLKPVYTQLASAKVSDSKSIVISACSTGGFTIASRMNVTDGTTSVKVFLKGATHVNDIMGLYTLRGAIDQAIKRAEQDEKIDDVLWDDMVQNAIDELKADEVSEKVADSE